MHFYLGLSFIVYEYFYFEIFAVFFPLRPLCSKQIGVGVGFFSM